jgi:A/G-specific adenine glycosylase
VVEVSPEQNHRQSAEFLLADLGLTGEVCEADAVRHAYSHFKLELTVFSVEIETKTSVAEAGEYAWYSEDALKRLPLHGAHKKVYSK